MSERETAQWKLAALLKDRTRREIRQRVKNGERALLVAEDFGVPVQFVEVVAAWQMFEDDPAPGDAPQLSAAHVATLRELADDLAQIVLVVSSRDGDATARQHHRAEAVRAAVIALTPPGDAPQTGASPQAEPPTCQWLDPGEDDNEWQTGCGKGWEFIDDGPTENGVKFCPYCGKPLALVPAEEDRCVQ